MAAGDTYLKDTDGETLLHTDGATAVHADCCCDAPCSCPSGLAACYQIADYVDASTFAACTACTNDNTRPWDGQFDYREFSNVCEWHWWDPADTPLITIGGKVPGIFTPETRLWLDTENCLWKIEVYCHQGAPVDEDHLIWSGQKATGQTPIGTYTRTGGCDTGLSALEIEACP